MGSHRVGHDCQACLAATPTPQENGSKKYFKSQAENWKMSCLSVWIKVCVSVSLVFFHSNSRNPVESLFSQRSRKDLEVTQGCHCADEGFRKNIEATLQLS